MEIHHLTLCSTLQECDTMLVQVVGENMKASFKAMGIEVKKVRQKDGNIADEVVKNFLNKTILKRTLEIFSLELSNDKNIK